jgi:hypothetical protein
MEFKQEYPEYTSTIETFMRHWTWLIAQGKAPPMICGKGKVNTGQNTKSKPRAKAVDESCQDIPCMNASDLMVLSSTAADLPHLGESFESKTVFFTHSCKLL